MRSSAEMRSQSITVTYEGSKRRTMSDQALECVLKFKTNKLAWNTPQSAWTLDVLKWCLVGYFDWLTLRVWSRGRMAGSSNILPKSGLRLLGM